MPGKKIEVRTKKGQSYSIIVAKNQKIIKIHRIANAINFKANGKAQRQLSPNAYALYMYLIRHEQNRVWALSSKNVFEETHLTINTYPKAVQELIDKNYLTKGTIDLGGGNQRFKDEAYHLWEVPSLRTKTEPVGKEVFKEYKKEDEEAYEQEYKRLSTEDKDIYNLPLKSR